MRLSYLNENYGYSPSEELEYLLKEIKNIFKSKGIEPTIIVRHRNDEAMVTIKGDRRSISVDVSTAQDNNITYRILKYPGEIVSSSTNPEQIAIEVYNYFTTPRKRYQSAKDVGLNDEPT